MPLANIDFPRGGKRPHTDEKTEVVEAKELFQIDSVKRQKVVVKKKKEKWIKSKSRLIEPLQFQDVSEGLLLLGMVKDVKEHQLFVSLPNGLFGMVSMACISNAYTKFLEKMVSEDAENAMEYIPTLKDFYQVGDAVPCRVLAKKTKEQKRFIELSIDPRDVNKGLPLTALKPGCLLFGAVSSKEEHGYMIDLGIPGICAFLQVDLTKKDTHLPVGKGVWCSLQTDAAVELIAGESRVVQVSINPSVVQQAEVTPKMATSIESLRPGMKTLVTVKKVLDEGLLVNCHQYSGSIYKSHAPLSLKENCIGQKVEARILYTNPLTKEICLTLLPGVVKSIGFENEQSQFGDLSVGDIIESATVRNVDKTNGIYFRLGSYTGFVSIKNWKENLLKDVNKKYPRGSSHRCRILGFHPIDDVVIISLKEEILNEKFMTLNDITPGLIVECTVELVHANGLIVQLSKRITGFVPNLQVADVPIKNVLKKYPKGSKLKCRVLRVNVEKKQVLLTNKRSLVNTTQLIPASYADLSPGQQLEGFIVSVNNKGVVVQFLNNIKGWVPRPELSTAEISDPEAVFYVGQVVRCRVLSCKPDEQKLKLSLIISGKAPLASKQESMEGFEVGKLVEAKVFEKTNTSVKVELLPSGHKAILPKDHLSDSAQNCELLWQALEPGQSLGDVMLFKQTNVVIVTRKESFVSAAREGIIPKNFAALEPGQLLPGVIKNHQTYGIFVELAGGLTGLAPHKFTMDRPVPDLESVFSNDQSVVVKVMKVKQEKSRFLCSLRMCDCFYDDPKVGVELMETYLREKNQYMKSILNKKVRDLKTGSLVMVEVTKATSSGYLCQTEMEIEAIVTVHHTGDAELNVGTKLEAVVLNIDPLVPCLEVSVDRSLVKSVSQRAEKPTMDKARVGQKIKANIVLVHDEFVLVALKQHAVGSLAYIPTKQHLNDVTAKQAFSIGEETHVIIQKTDGSVILANLESRIPEAVAKKGKVLKERHNLQLGQVVTAQIQAMYPCQMNVKIGKVNARVHVTEVVDELQNGKYAYIGYKKGQDVKLKIIGFRHLKSLKYLPISHPRIHKAMPECTLRPSKMGHAGCPEEDLASFEKKYKPGDKVLVFVIKFDSNKLWVNISPTQRGVISIFDMSRDLGVLQHAEKHFLAGHGYMATILSVEEEGLFHLTLTGKKEEVKKNKIVTGRVTSVSDSAGIFLRLPGDCRGRVPPDEIEDAENNASHKVSAGLFVRCKILSCKDKEKCVLTLRLGHRADENTISPIKKTESLCKEDDAPLKQKVASGKKRKINESVTKTEKALSPASSLAVENRLIIAEGFSWDEPRKSELHATSEDDDDEEEEIPKKKQKTDIQFQPVRNGEQAKDYDKLLLSRPNDSMLWIEFMSEHLNSGDIERARAVAEQALKTISFREEQEKLNVWIALLNLENLYGSKEQVTQTFQRALQVNDPMTLYRRVAAMYIASSKMEEAEQTYQTMVRKFKQTKQAWTDFGLFLYRQGRMDAARNLLQRSLLSLQRFDHVDTIAKFAQMEFSNGEPERGATMFEKIIAEFPRRSDIMSIYIDMVVKSGDLDRARELLERGISSKKNTAFFFKKYLAFEEKYGNEETLARVKAKIEAQC